MNYKRILLGGGAAALPLRPSAPQAPRGFQQHAKNIPNKYTKKYTKHIPKLYQNYSQNIPNIHPRYTKMSKIDMKYQAAAGPGQEPGAARPRALGLSGRRSDPTSCVALILVYEVSETYGKFTAMNICYIIVIEI